jgi:hypothetical protein
MTGMSLIERMSDRDYIAALNRELLSERVHAEDAEVEVDALREQLAWAVDYLHEARRLLSGDLDGGVLGDARKLLDVVLQRLGGQ